MQGTYAHVDSQMARFFARLNVWVVILNLMVFKSLAQLSPGKLSQAHSKLEGLSNCTQCHSIGNKVANQNCLNCHKELAGRIARHKGYHASVAIKGKECIACHSEHHGLGFDMVRFDKKTFNHSLTGYELKGSHKTNITNCNQCHKPENMTDLTVKNKAKTYLGLDTKCSSCHDDYHQKTLSGDCALCHDFTDFKSAPLFDHNKTHFVLRGQHKSLDCAACHKAEVRNNKPFVKYAGVSFGNCTSCHKDEHKGRYGSECGACHSENSFHKITPPKHFNHSATGYALEGKHREVSCKKCHEQSFGTTTSFREFATSPKQVTCVLCHQDVHEGKLGTDCKSCHNQNSFLLLSKDKQFVGKFSHDQTGYPLQGKHSTVDCRSCHRGDLTEPVAHNHCTSCHQDKHRGDFDTKKDKYPDCVSCHTVEGFRPSSFTLEMHNRGAFKLKGAHVAQPCNACHLNQNSEWTFAKMGRSCLECHGDTHAGHLNPKYYVSGSCSNCHQEDSWQQVRFDHTSTGYSLSGKHAEASCSACHFDRSTSPITQRFGGLSRQCATCHRDVHGGQFARNGATDCAKCHSTQSWNGTGFDHNKTSFKLDGKHQQVACEKCHKTLLTNNSQIKNFKIPKHQCVDCHM